MTYKGRTLKNGKVVLWIHLSLSRNTHSFCHLSAISASIYILASCSPCPHSFFLSPPSRPSRGLPAAMLPSSDLLLVLVSTALALLFLRAIYDLFLSPLSAIPGPWYAAISDAWINYHVLRLRQCKTVQRLFEIYGPVVRIGPNKVAFCDLTSMRNVYSVYKFDKSTYYKSLLTYALVTYRTCSAD